MHQHRTAEHASFMKFSFWSAFLFAMKCGIMEMIVFAREQNGQTPPCIFQTEKCIFAAFSLALSLQSWYAVS